MDDTRVLTESAYSTGHTVIKAGADGKHHVSLVHGIVGIHSAVHTKPAHRERVILRHGSNTHECGSHGNLGTFSEFTQLLRGI